MGRLLMGGSAHTPDTGNVRNPRGCSESNVALVIVSRIQLYRDDAGNVAAEGGTMNVLDPGALDDTGLSALAYEHRLP